MTGRQTGSKVDPSFKSKRYRDKLRTEVKALENLLPVDRPALHRKLDSQTVYRLVIAYLRLKAYFRAHSYGLAHRETDEKQNGEDTTGSCEKIVHSKETTINSTGTDKTCTTTKAEVEGLLHSSNLFQQVLDGFLLVLSADGTILYVSENVLQYLGFNQVDLMHRCIYGSVHPEDQLELRSTLEHTPTSSDPDSNPAATPEEKVVKDQESVAVMFMFRMSCFTGSAAGYSKLYCTGKIENVRQMPKTPRTSDSIVLLYCQPFMINAGCDVTPELRREVFWSKHDLDLRFKDIDKKTESIVGYGCDELHGRSFYDLVHPDDLFTCVTVHKALSESSEVQSMYFRLQNKDGGWLWLHSRGKVISKNSKKFSIVFTHCPIRDEDGVFIQQESTTRQKYALADLVCQQRYTLVGSQQFRTTNYINGEYNPHNNLRGIVPNSQPLVHTLSEDTACMLQTNNDTCPSTWHALGDRHSPVLPSSHVAHKLTQRDKQLQFAEFKRKQQTDQQAQSVHRMTGSTDYDVHTPMTYGQVIPVVGSIPDHLVASQYAPAIAEQIMAHPNYSPIQISPYNMYAETGTRFQPSLYDWTHNTDYPNITQSHGFHFPPSPPPSPKQRLPKVRRIVTDNRNNKLPIKDEPTPADDRRTKSDCVYQHGKQHCTRGKSPLQAPHANIRMSLHYNIPESPVRMFDDTCQRDVHSVPNLLSQHQVGQFNAYSTTTVLPANHIDFLHLADNERKLCQTNSQSCAISSGCCTVEDKTVRYDVETSIHMTIVENVESSTSESKLDVDIPAIGSFLEYLNEH